MSKESREAGLHKIYFAYAPEDQRAKAESAPRRGTFVPDCTDKTRLFEHLHGCERRMS